MRKKGEGSLCIYRCRTGPETNRPGLLGVTVLDGSASSRFLTEATPRPHAPIW
jgi:hypothetical protein